MRVEGAGPDWPPAAGRASLVTSAVAELWRDRPAMKRPASLTALSMERQGYEPLPGVVCRRFED